MKENCENYEIALRARTVPNCTCRDCVSLRDELIECFSKASKAYEEILHRTRVKLLKQRALDALKAGYYDVPGFEFSEMLKKSYEKVRMITISLPDGDISSQVSFVNSVIKRLKFIPVGAEWVYEQRGDSQETCGSGLHVHLIMPVSKKSPFETARDLSRPLKIESNYVHVKTLPVDAAKEYLFGEKRDDKKLKQQFDRVMREYYSIEDKYVK